MTSNESSDISPLNLAALLSSAPGSRWIGGGMARLILVSCIQHPQGTVSMTFTFREPRTLCGSVSLQIESFTTNLTDASPVDIDGLAERFASIISWLRAQLTSKLA